MQTTVILIYSTAFTNEHSAFFKQHSDKLDFHKVLEIMEIESCSVYCQRICGGEKSIVTIVFYDLGSIIQYNLVYSILLSSVSLFADFYYIDSLKCVCVWGGGEGSV